MFEQMKIYHVKHKEGIIIKYENGIYFIDFNGTVKQVTSGNWLKSLFINRIDAYKQKESIDLSSYENILAYDNNMKAGSQNLKPIRIKKGRRDRLVENFWVEGAETCSQGKKLNNNYVDIDENTIINEKENVYDEESIDDSYFMNEDAYEENGYFSGYYPGHQDYEIDDIVYEAYIEDPWDISSFNEIIQQTKDEEIEFEKIQNEITLINNKEKFILKKSLINREEERCIVVIFNELIKLNNKNYFKVIGIDVRTAKIVTIVDTNGKEKNLLSYNYKVYQLIGKSVVIKAKFESLEYSDRQNILRIVSDFRVVSEFNIDSLNDLDWKYHVLSSDELGLIPDFDIVETLSKEYMDNPFHLLVNFTDTQIKKKRNQTEFCIKMGDVYPVIKDKSILNINNQDKHYRGIALITWRTNNHGEIKFYVEKMYGRVLNVEEIDKLKFEVSNNSETNSSEHELDSELVFDNSDSLDMDPYYFDEYLDRNVFYNEETDIDNEDNIMEARNQENAYWFSNDEYIEGSGFNEDFLW